MDKEMLELYSDYLIASSGATTATGLAQISGGGLSHDAVTRFLRESRTDSGMLWKLVKPLVRQLQQQSGDAGILIYDDTIIEKPYTDENEIVNWYYDHSRGHHVKGMNLLTGLYHRNGVSVPVTFEVISKRESVEAGTGRKRWKSGVTKNEHLRRTLGQCVKNGLEVRYVLADSWYGCSATMRYIKEELGIDFIMPLKGNRKVAVSRAAKERGEYRAISSLPLEEHATKRVYLSGVAFAVLLSKVVFKNGDDTCGVLYLAASDLEHGFEEISTTYNRRWAVEEYHQGLKSAVSVRRSPTKRVQTQRAHILAALYAFVKLERISKKLGRSRQEIKSAIYFHGLRSALEKLSEFHAAARFKPILCVR